MWLYNAPPRAVLKDKYGFELTDSWLEHLQLASVRMGASAEFVSQDGLVLSNHHVGSRSLQRLSTKEHRLSSRRVSTPALPAKKKYVQARNSASW